MHEHTRRMAVLPAIRPIVVQRELIGVVQRYMVLHCAVRQMWPRQIGARERLCVAADDQRVRTKRIKRDSRHNVEVLPRLPDRCQPTFRPVVRTVQPNSMMLRRMRDAGLGEQGFLPAASLPPASRILNPYAI